MVKRGDKTGQFYLIGGIMIAVVIIGVAVVSNYMRKEAGIDISDLKDEIKIESSYVMDYALINGLSFDDVLKDFTDEYRDYFRREKSNYFIFGDRDEMTVAGYQTEDYSVSLNEESVTDSKGDFEESINPGGAENIILEIDDNSYIFPISQGKNFYFVVSQSAGNEEHIITG